MTREEKNMTIDYLKGMQEGYIEGEGYERHPLPEWYALDKAIEAMEEESCEDAISRQAVIYYIKGHINEIITESGIDKNEHTNRVLRAIINGVETMPSVNPQPRWIPVSERLPEESGEYIIAIADNDCPTVQFFEISWFYSNTHSWSYLNADVIAWMPLPEPYKAESEEEDANSN